ncbi:MAG: hypothetical protein RBR74_11440, partial [Ignavibacteriaceae bacterium]|nr:hypothetical protein [Ignavibacteriaceae bacterium]
MKIFISITFAVLLICLFNSCHSEVVFPGPSLGLGLKAYSCTEAWIEIQVGNNDKTANIYLQKDGQTIQTIRVSQSDSVIYFDDLIPNSSCRFDALTYVDGKELKSNSLIFTTLDTTAHNLLTWQTFSFGEHSTSALYDAAIIDENNIWTVGEIYMNDSTGNPDLKKYNALKWNGSNWDMLRIPFTYQGTDYNTIKSVYAFSADDIWFAGNNVIWWNGSEFKTVTVPPDVWGSYQINKIWGRSSNNLYIIGSKGSIACYNGNSWSKIESGTTSDLINIWGSQNENTIWICGVNNDYGISTLLKIKNGVAGIIFEGYSNTKSNGYYVGPVSSLWSDNDYRVFLMNWSGICLQKNSDKLFLEKQIAAFSNMGLGMDGSSYNNVFTCGQRLLGHWNGISFMEYKELITPQRTLMSINTRSSIVCSVGLDYNGPVYSNAVIILG